MSEHWSLAVAWEWRYDGDFVERLRAEAAAAGLTFLSIRPGDVGAVIERLAAGSTIGCYLDRASDVDSRFAPIEGLVQAAGGRVLNRNAMAVWASDKATMHMEFLTHGLVVPYTLLLPPFAERPEVTAEEFSRLPRPFVIKPASFGGGEGVVTGDTMADIRRARAMFPGEKYLIQEKVEPVLLDGRRAWFRPLFVLGEVCSMWWDDRTHVYDPLTPGDEQRYGLAPVRDMMLRIAGVSGLDFFSAEICLDSAGRFLVVDYVNVPCDMRVRSLHPRGVPDAVVAAVARRIVSAAAGMPVPVRAAP